jgi:DNA-binding GntR family transcriptional regulator
LATKLIKGHKLPKPIIFETKTLVDRITEYLTGIIINGDLKPGERLVEQELQKRFNTSRSPIRESIRILSEKGLVVNLPRKGTYVRSISIKDIKNNFPITAHLEALAARLALPNLKSKDIKNMELFLSKMKEAARQNNVEDYVKYHYKFNDTFIMVSENDLLIGLLKNLRYQMAWFKFHNYFLRGFKRYVLEVHSDILDLFKEKKVDQLEALTKEHAFFAFDQFLRYVEKEKGENQAGILRGLSGNE